MCYTHTNIHTITYVLSTRHPNSARPGSRERGWGGAPSPQILTFMYYCTVVKATDSAAMRRGELEGNGTWPWGLKNMRDTFLPVLSVENMVGCGADILRTGFQKVMNPHTAGGSITPARLLAHLPARSAGQKPHTRDVSCATTRLSEASQTSVLQSSAAVRDRRQQV